MATVTSKKSPSKKQVAPSTQQIAKEERPYTDEEYSKLHPREQCRMKPGMYIGSIRREDVQEWVYDFEQQVPIKKTNDIPYGVKSIFWEILSNALDNVIRSRNQGFDPKDIEVKMDKQQIEITNKGMPIPIVMHKLEKKLVPEVIFTDFFSGSNYDKKRKRFGVGTNGLGSKVVFCFSVNAKVYIEDHINKKTFEQTYKNNLTEISSPIVLPFKGSSSLVRISYNLDFPYFDMIEYEADAFELFARYTMDASLACQIPTKFNELSFNVNSLNEMAKYYIDSDIVDKSILYECDCKMKKINKKTATASEEKEEEHEGHFSICIMDTPYEGMCLGFTNGLQVNSGVHVDAIYKEIADVILPELNAEVGVSAAGRSLLNIKDIKQHISIAFVCQLPDPEFTSQTKTELAAPTPIVNIPQKILIPMKKWNFIDRLKNILQQKESSQLSKTDGKKSRIVDVPKLIDANWAGTNKSHLCTITLTEGDSAASTAAKLRIDNNIDGVFPLRGKMLNVTNATMKRIILNKEIQYIKEIIGLQEKTDYSDDINYKKLRYGFIRIFADQDENGFHIVALVLNFFDKFYPSLVKRGCIEVRMSPIIRIWRGHKERSKAKKVLSFHSLSQFENWKQTTPEWKSYKLQYFKGLGTMTDADIKSDRSAELTCAKFNVDEEAQKSLQLAFDKNFAEQRKTWLKTWNPNLEMGLVKNISVTDYINKVLIHYSVLSYQRFICSFTDGLKASQRTIMMAVFKKWKSHSDSSLVKVSQMANYTAENFMYHHGENSLQQCIIAMTQSFVGSNNLRYFEDGGQFGSRNMGGSDSASPRYIFCAPEKWIYEVFKQEDNDLLDYVLNDDGEPEPKNFLPIFPMWSVNGTSGLSTGYSSFIPCHDPEDICNWLTKRIDNAKLPKIHPWYRNFRGKLMIEYVDNTKYTYQEASKDLPIIEMEKKKRRTKKQSPKPEQGSSASVDTLLEDTDIEESETVQDEPQPEIESGFVIDDDDDNSNVLEASKPGDGKKVKSLVSLGVYEAILNKGVGIKELPLNSWTNKYVTWLRSLKAKKEITDIIDKSDELTEDINIWIPGFSQPSIKKLRLRSSMGLNNMYMLNENMLPEKQNGIEEWLERFYQFRLPYYQKRKELISKQLSEKIDQCHEKRLFVQAVVDKKLLLANRTKKEIEDDCTRLNINSKYMSMYLSSLTQEQIQDLLSTIQRLNEEKARIEASSPGDIWKADLQSFLAVYRKTLKPKKKDADVKK